MTRIKFGTDGWRAIIAKDYTFDNLTRVTEATISWLKDTYKNPSLMVGYDCRFNGVLFAEHVANIAAQNGVKVFISPGFVSTPMVSLATFKRQASAGIIITASHNPPSYSGFKIKGHFGGPATPPMISAVEDRIPDTVTAYTEKFEELVDAGQIEYYDMEALYINHIKEVFDLKLIRESGMKIGYDAMFGAGQNVVRKLLPAARLVHCEFNPSFNGTPPEPIEKNLKEFQQIIRDEGIEVGLTTDGDADRIGMFDERGEFVDSHRIILLLIHYLVKYKGLSGKVVTTFSATGKIAKLCEHYGLPIDITKIGFKYVCDIMLKENVIVGGEESGGISIAGHVPERDGIFIGLAIVEFMAKTGKSLVELIQEVYDIVGAFAYGRNDLHINQDKKWEVVDKCKAGAFTAFGDFTVQRVETTDGFKFHFSDTEWVMIRPSGTEPVLRVYAEAPDKAGVQNILTQVIDTILA